MAPFPFPPQEPLKYKDVSLKLKVLGEMKNGARYKGVALMGGGMCVCGGGRRGEAAVQEVE